MTPKIHRIAFAVCAVCAMVVGCDNDRNQADRQIQEKLTQVAKEKTKGLTPAVFTLYNEIANTNIGDGNLIKVSSGSSGLLAASSASEDFYQLGLNKMAEITALEDKAIGQLRNILSFSSKYAIMKSTAQDISNTDLTPYVISLKSTVDGRNGKIGNLVMAIQALETQRDGVIADIADAAAKRDEAAKQSETLMTQADAAMGQNATELSQKALDLRAASQKQSQRIDVLNRKLDALKTELAQYVEQKNLIQKSVEDFEKLSKDIAKTESQTKSLGAAQAGSLTENSSKMIKAVAAEYAQTAASLADLQGQAKKAFERSRYFAEEARKKANDIQSNPDPTVKTTWKLKPESYHLLRLKSDVALSSLMVDQYTLLKIQADAAQMVRQVTKDSMEDLKAYPGDLNEIIKEAPESLTNLMDACSAYNDKGQEISSVAVPLYASICTQLYNITGKTQYIKNAATAVKNARANSILIPPQPPIIEAEVLAGEPAPKTAPLTGKSSLKAEAPAVEAATTKKPTTNPAPAPSTGAKSPAQSTTKEPAANAPKTPDATPAPKTKITLGGAISKALGGGGDEKPAQADEPKPENP